MDSFIIKSNLRCSSEGKIDFIDICSADEF